MATDHRNQTITRYRPAHVIPLELWDLLVEGQVLWETMQEAAFPQILRVALEQLQRGDGATRSAGRVPGCLAGFDSLYLTGGRSQEPLIRAALSGFSASVCFSQTPGFPGEREGLRLLRGHGATACWVCDLGQTSFKICDQAGRRKQFLRDLNLLPLRTDSEAESIPEQRRQIRQWLSTSLIRFLNESELPLAVLFALPSRLDDQGVPEGSSYIGMGGDEFMVSEVLAAAGVQPQRVLTVNDAELAALDALAEPRLSTSAKTLTLTLGFGVGAALALRKLEER